jgi:photosystem II stability/assembly factor-like uncharacterized protein
MREVYYDSTSWWNDVTKIHFLSPSNGFVAFEKGIGYTTDSGRTYQIRDINWFNVNYNAVHTNLTFGFNINGVYAFDKDNIVTYGHYGWEPSILISNNGGLSFTQVYHSNFTEFENEGIMDMAFPQNSTLGFAVEKDKILRTTNKGLSWNLVRTDANRYYSRLDPISSSTVFAYSFHYDHSDIQRTTNSGDSWQSISRPPGRLLAASFLSASKGWILQDNGICYYTADGGNTWTAKNNPAIHPLFGLNMKYINDTTGFLMGDAVYKTTDGGQIWEKLPDDSRHMGSFHELFLWNTNQFWAGGAFAKLHLTTNGGGTPIPTALFTIDTTGLATTNTVNLLNYSKTGYSFSWYRNDVLISTSYHASYTHIPGELMDHIKLVVTNGTVLDSAVKDQYFYPKVVVNSFSPDTAVTGDAVLISGNEFIQVTDVSFGGVPAAAYTVISPNLIRAKIGNGASGSVTVSTLTGTGSHSGFTYIPPPGITSFVPATASSGTVITISGNNFSPDAQVSFGGQSAQSVQYISATTILATVTSGASGSVVVKTRGGTASMPGFQMLPVISAFAPSSGTYATNIMITGSGLGDVTSISVGGTPVLSFTINSHSSITAIVGTGTSGNVVVTNAGGSFSLGTFTWYPPPTITSFSPASGPVGTTVTVTGTNFLPTPSDNTVFFGSANAVVTAATTTQLTVIVPAGASYQPISVTKNGLTAFSQMPFLVTFTGGGSITANSFAPRQSFTGSGFHPTKIAAADLEGDGKLDLVMLNRPSTVVQQNVQIWPNTTASTQPSFASPILLALKDPIGLAIADLDGDGKLDLAVTTDDDSLLLFRNNSSAGTISFTPLSGIPTPAGLQSVAITDLDGDGRPDVVITGNIISVLRNTSDPGKITFASRLDFTSGRNHMILTDLDGDGKSDIALSSYNVNSIKYLRNTSILGTISFVEAEIPAEAPWNIAAADINSDSKMDLISTDVSGSKVSLFQNNGSTGVISFEVEKRFPCTSYPNGVGISDLDGDGKPDVAIATMANNLAILKNQGTIQTMNFSPIVAYDRGNYLSNNQIALADINGDGKDDALVTSESTSALYMYVNQVKTEPFIQSFAPAIAESGTTVTITGNNFTGTTAVLFGNQPASSFSVLSPTSISAIVGGGSTGSVTVTNLVGSAERPGFSFGFPPVITSFTPASGPVGTSVTITGTNFSSDAEVYFGSVKAVTSFESSTTLRALVPAGALYLPFSVRSNNLTALSPAPFVVTFSGAQSTIFTSQFAPRADFVVDGGTEGFLGDMDKDGKIDVVVMGLNTTVSVALNASTGTNISFAPARQFALAPMPMRIRMAELDGDGRPDIVLYSNNNKGLSVLRNTSTPGSVSFAPKVDFIDVTSTSVTTDMAIHDLDGDGRPDVIGTYHSDHTYSIYRNISTPGKISFDLKEDFLASQVVDGLVIHDLNGDHKPDLVFISGSSILLQINTSTPGKISFSDPVSLYSAGSPYRLAIGDLDGDGRADLSVTSLVGTTVLVFRNTSTGSNVSFGAPASYTVESTNEAIVSIGDLDGDGRPEIFTAGKSTYSVSVLKNNSSPGSINFGSYVPFSFISNARTPMSLSGDMDADGITDLVLFNGGSVVSIFRRLASGSSTPHVCTNGSVTLTSSLSGLFYQWQQNLGGGFVNISNGPNFSGTDTKNLQIMNPPQSWNNSTYRCLVNNGSSVSSEITLLVDTAPSANAGPDQAICAGVAVTIGTPTTPVNTISWSSSPAGFSGNTPNPSVSPIVTTNYFLSVSNSGCTSNDTVMVSVTPKPEQPLISASAFTACGGGSITLTSSANAGNQWALNNMPITGANGSSYVPGQSGMYTVVSSINGCSSLVSGPVSITIYPLPPTPIITASGNVLTSSAPSGNQWYLNGQPITGANNATYTITTAGLYTVKVTLNGCSSALSSGLSMVPTAVTAPDLEKRLIMLPNPVRSVLEIQYKGNTAPFEVKVFDLSGKTLHTQKSTGTSCLLNLSQLSAGPYIIHIQNLRSGEEAYKLIIRVND